MNTVEPGSAAFQAYGRAVMCYVFTLVATCTVLALLPGYPRWIPITLGAVAIIMAANGVPVLKRYRTATQTADGMPGDRRVARRKTALQMGGGMLVMAGIGVVLIVTA